MYTAWFCEVPQEAVPLIQKGLDQLYGVGEVALESLPVSKLRPFSRLFSRQPQCVLAVVGEEVANHCTSDFWDAPGALRYTSYQSVVSWFRDNSVELEAPTEISTASAIPIDYYTSRIKYLEDYIAEAEWSHSLGETTSPVLLDARTQERDDLSVKVLEQAQRISELEAKLSHYSPVATGEVVELRKQVAMLEAEPLLQLSTVTSLNSQPSLTQSSLRSTDQVKLFFTSSDGDYREGYKLLRRWVQELSYSSPVVVLDLCTESRLDYEFQTSLEGNLQWLLDPSSDVTHLPRIAENVWAVSSGGTKYINDLAYLRVSWGDKLNQLVKDNRKVVLFGGCLNSAVPRILYNSLATVSKPLVYTGGLMVSLRSTLINLRGLARPPLVVSRGYNPEARNLWQMLVDNYETVILDQNTSIAEKL